jgi:hypothetical protein
MGVCLLANPQTIELFLENVPVDDAGRLWFIVDHRSLNLSNLNVTLSPGNQPGLEEAISEACRTRHLVQQKRIARELISGLFLYTCTDPAIRQRQRLTRRGNQSLPTVIDASRLEVSPDEMKAAIILFYSLLDEQQRRLYAGLESKTRPRRRQRAGRSPWPRSAYHCPRGRRQLLDQEHHRVITHPIWGDEKR